MAAFVKETEAAPRRCYSSSATKSYDDILHHQLCSSNSWEMETVCTTKALPLDEIPLPEKKNEKVTFKARVNADRKDKHVGEYVRGLVPSDLDGLSVSVDRELALFNKKLHPFMKSVRNRPDVALLKDGLPLVLVEVQSSPFRDSLCKTAVDLIDQLRLLRNYDRRINHCTGFTFPDFKSRVCVAKVLAKWKSFCFNISYTPLTSWGQVKTEVGQAIQESLEVCTGIDTAALCDTFFIPLSSEDLQAVGECVNRVYTDERILHQVYSRQSIVLEGEQYFWKYNPNVDEERKLHDLRDYNSSHILPIYRIKVRKLGFFGIEKQSKPLSREEALSCLYSLVENVAAELEGLHRTDNVAHLDVRLENICFRRSTGSVIFIDFDRFEEADTLANFHTVYNSVMYDSGRDWTCEQLDWKQLGLMIAWIICGYHDYHNIKLEKLHSELLQDQFLHDLLYEGMYYSEALFQKHCLCIHNYLLIYMYTPNPPSLKREIKNRALAMYM